MATGMDTHEDDDCVVLLTPNLVASENLQRTATMWKKYKLTMSFNSSDNML